MTVLISIFTYMIGMFMFCVETIFNSRHENSDTFASEYGLLGMSARDRVVVILYFSFTSLSTVGLGDLHAISDIERISQSFVLLLGVATFSYIMNNFLIILNKS